MATQEELEQVQALWIEVGRLHDKAFALTQNLTSLSKKEKEVLQKATNNLGTTWLNLGGEFS